MHFPVSLLYILPTGGLCWYSIQPGTDPLLSLFIHKKQYMTLFNWRLVLEAVHRTGSTGVSHGLYITNERSSPDLTKLENKDSTPTADAACAVRALNIRVQCSTR